MGRILRILRWLDHDCTLLEHDWQEKEYANEIGHTKVYRVCQKCGRRRPR